MKDPAQHGLGPVKHGTCLVAAFVLLAAVSPAQQPIGTVVTENASISGLVTVSNQKATIANQGSITAATDRTAELTLTRGGVVRVCSTSSIHVSQANATDPPLLLALDRGALEASFPVTASDMLMTPDLRFQASAAGELNLHLRVTPNGDTCVDNRSKADAPLLHVTSAFGPEGYFIKPGQHLLFVGGSLTRVIDTETTACGCPPPQPEPAPVPVQVAEGKPVTPTQAAAQHPFPEAQSAGLAPGPVTDPVPIGEVHTQIATTLSVNGNAPKPIPPPPPAPEPQPPAQPKKAAEKPATKSNAFQKIGHFFKHIFGGGKQVGVSGN
ncbi:nuclease [Terriglobus albidus]|uniref:nuclease n=1 Tax=Terriglobus albidus TaxID=1592106 RepID=UPI0021E044C9|nr:nuclease [Terriglobus albidus]